MRNIFAYGKVYIAHQKICLCRDVKTESEIRERENEAGNESKK